MSNLPDFRQMPAADRANWYQAHPENVRVLEIYHRYCFDGVTVTDGVIPSDAAIVAESPTEFEQLADIAARDNLTTSPQGVVAVRWRWYPDGDFHEITR